MRRFLASLAIVTFTLTVVPVLAGAQNASVPDVIVVGGTPAGVAAAVAAARRGLHVELDVAREKLGGVLTGAMMDQWDLNTGPAGAVIERGIFSQIAAELGDVFTPEHAESALAALVAQSPNIDLHFGRIPLGALVEPTSAGRYITRVVFRTKHGTLTSLAPFVIDATDDGDVAALAGARYDLGRQDMGRDAGMQAATLMFSLRDIDVHELFTEYRPARFGPGGADGSRVWGFSTLLRTYRPADPAVLVRDLNLGIAPDGEVTVNAIDILGINGLDARSVADGSAKARAEAPHLIAFLRERVPGFENARLSHYAQTLYIRETRHVLGLAYVTATDVWDGRIPADSIGIASYPLDLHPVTATDTLAYAPERHVYGIPLGALVPAGFANLILASRAISASHVAAGSVRIVPTTIEEGEAAGAACALALHEHTTFDAIDRSPKLIADLRADLSERGVVLAVPSSGRTALRA